MPSGCEFICKNEKCEHYKKGLVITGPWPLGDIDSVIDANNVKKNQEFREGLIKLRDSGRKLACITYPNVSEIPMVGYRIQKWCDQCHNLWMYDVLLENENDTLENALERSNVPNHCPKCNKDMENFEGLLSLGIHCPHCNEEMQQNRWFAKQGIKEEEHVNEKE